MSVLFVTQALFILCVPFILAFFMAFIAVEQKPYGNFFTHNVTIFIAGAIMCILFLFLLNKYKARIEYPINYVILGLLTIAQACFFGGLCSHAYIATVGLAGVMIAASSSCVGAAITSASGKSRHLKKTIFVCIFLGFLIYISVFVWGWNVI